MMEHGERADILPLLPTREERAGERRAVLITRKRRRQH